MTFEMMDEMNQALADVQDDHGIKALVITGSGRAFSVGADITLLSGAFDSPRQMRHFLETINQLFFNIEVLPVPVIAGVNGLAWAGGFELALSCDLAIAADDAKIGDNHTNFWRDAGRRRHAASPAKDRVTAGPGADLHGQMADR